MELYYFNARWYDPEIGRFITEDSVADDPNLYGYCRQNPINRIDPTGHFSLGPIKFQSGLSLVGATMSAAAMLTGNDDLATLSTAFTIFVMVHDRIEEVKRIEELIAKYQNSESSESAEDPPNKLPDETVFIHGYNSNWTIWANLFGQYDPEILELAEAWNNGTEAQKNEITKIIQNRLKDYNIFVFDYSTMNKESPKIIGDSFAQFLRDYKLNTGKANVVSHSMGALVTRNAVLNNDDIKFNKWAAIAPANQGSPLATLASIIPFAGSPATTYMNAWSKELDELNSEIKADKLRHHISNIKIFTSTWDYVVPTSYTPIPYLNVDSQLYQGLPFALIGGTHNTIYNVPRVQQDVMKYLFGKDYNIPR